MAIALLCFILHCSWVTCHHVWEIANSELGPMAACHDSSYHGIQIYVGIAQQIRILLVPPAFQTNYSHQTISCLSYGQSRHMHNKCWSEKQFLQGHNILTPPRVQWIRQASQQTIVNKVLYNNEKNQFDKIKQGLWSVWKCRVTWKLLVHRTNRERAFSAVKSIS
jgi:hypothetical protein